MLIFEKFWCDNRLSSQVKVHFKAKIAISLNRNAFPSGNFSSKIKSIQVWNEKLRTKTSKFYFRNKMWKFFRLLSYDGDGPPSPLAYALEAEQPSNGNAAGGKKKIARSKTAPKPFEKMEEEEEQTKDAEIQKINEPPKFGWIRGVLVIKFFSLNYACMARQKNKNMKNWIRSVW